MTVKPSKSGQSSGVLNWVGQRLDHIVSVYNPVSAVKRAQARRVFSYYEAAKPTKSRKQRKEISGPNIAVGRAGPSLREQARHLEQNHDVARGVLAVLIANTIGPNGIGVEPQPRNKDGDIHKDMAKQILSLHRDWAKRPEVTWQLDWPSAQRLMARSFYRDGECFAQRILGNVLGLDHGSRVPYSLELMEADMVPLNYDNTTIIGQAAGASSGAVIRQGFELNAWGRPLAIYVYREHPTDSYKLLAARDLRRIPANRMLHPKLVDRIRQLRGVSIFTSVLGRLDDIKDYEESERVAAKVAASMAAFIKKGSPEDYTARGETDSNDEPEPRKMKFRAGMVFDDLFTGEDIGTIDTNRPNVNLDKFVNGQMRRVASGTNTGYSSVSKNYAGNYSAQRQELVESDGAYKTLSGQFIGSVVRPVYEDFLAAAIVSGQLILPRDLDHDTLDDALFIPPQMPWVDPLKEAIAQMTLERSGYKSAQQIIRERGGIPADIMRQIAEWRKEADEKGLVFDSDPSKTAKSGTAQDYLRDDEANNNDNNSQGTSNAKKANIRSV